MPVSTTPRPALVGLFAALFALGCAEEDGPELPRAGGPSGGGSVSGGSGAGGEQSGSGGATAGAVSGRVRQFRGDEFLLTELAETSGEVAAEAPRAADPWVDTEFTADGFSLAGARRGEGTWIAVESSEAGYFTTLGLFDTTLGSADPVLVTADIVTSIFDTLAVPEDPFPSSGHLVVRVEDEAGDLVPGVQVQLGSASFVTYASAGSWTEFADRTTDEGIAFLGNIPADAVPGETVSVTLAGAMTGTFEALVAAGAVTVVTLEREP